MLRDVVRECEAALASTDPAALILDAVHTALNLEGHVYEADPLTTQLRAIEFEAERIEVYGVERTKSRLAYAHALLGLPFKWWK